MTGFDQTKRRLADLPIAELEELVESGREVVDEFDNLVAEVSEEREGFRAMQIMQELAELGLWIVRREQQSRRN